MDSDNPPAIVKVKTVAEEYEFIRKQECKKCGQIGTYKVEMQSLVFSRGFPCDDLNCTCLNCGHKKTFVFDVTTLFDGYKKQFGSDM
jgi:hypothetical protein